MGKGILDSMMTASTDTDPKSSTTPSEPQTQVPPPLPWVEQYYASVDGEPAGPFTKEQLAAYVKAKKIDHTTLIWKPGQHEWCEASRLDELNEIWPQTPPPIPPK